MHVAQEAAAETELTLLTMVSHTVPTRLTLFLLCCAGPWLFTHMAPTPRLPTWHQRNIVLELWDLSKKLLEDYLKNEMEVPESKSYLLPCLTSDSQPPGHVNSSALLPYFKAIRPLSDNKIAIDEVIEQLDKLKYAHGPEVNISVPAGAFESKRFILAILRQFSTCMEQKFKLLNSVARKVI